MDKAKLKTKLEFAISPMYDELLETKQCDFLIQCIVNYMDSKELEEFVEYVNQENE